MKQISAGLAHSAGLVNLVQQATGFLEHNGKKTVSKKNILVKKATGGLEFKEKINKKRVKKTIIGT